MNILHSADSSACRYVYDARRATIRAILHTTHATRAPYAYDGNGNVTDITADDGSTLIAHYEYDPFGAITKSSGSFADANTIRFSTKHFEPGHGIGDWGYRWYSPNYERWLSRDTIGESDGPNVHAFVGNAPVGRYDILGRSTASRPPPVWSFPSGIDWKGECDIRSATLPIGSESIGILYLDCHLKSPCHVPRLCMYTELDAHALFALGQIGPSLPLTIAHVPDAAFKTGSVRNLADAEAQFTGFSLMADLSFQVFSGISIGKTLLGKAMSQGLVGGADGLDVLVGVEGAIGGSWAYAQEKMCDYVLDTKWPGRFPR